MQQLADFGATIHVGTHTIQVRTIDAHQSLLPAMVQLRVPAALDWFIFYHHKQGNKAEADKYREMRKKFPDLPKTGAGDGDRKALPIQGPERTSPKNSQGKQATKTVETAKTPMKCSDTKGAHT